MRYGIGRVSTRETPFERTRMAKTVARFFASEAQKR